MAQPELEQPEIKNAYRLVGFGLFGLVCMFALLGFVGAFNKGAQDFFFGEGAVTDSDTLVMAIGSGMFIFCAVLMMVGVLMNSPHFFWPLIILFYAVMFYWVALVYVTYSATWLFGFFFVALFCYSFIYGVSYTRQEIIRNQQAEALNR